MYKDFEIVVGKYKYTFYQDGTSESYRNNLPWRDTTGDNLILCMAQRIKELEEEVEEYVDAQPPV